MAKEAVAAMIFFLMFVVLDVVGECWGGQGVLSAAAHRPLP
jgi:hypothetical protein